MFILDRMSFLDANLLADWRITFNSTHTYEGKVLNFRIGIHTGPW